MFIAQRLLSWRPTGAYRGRTLRQPARVERLEDRRLLTGVIASDVPVDTGGEDWSTGSISGHKFNDLNCDGCWQKEYEPGLEGWTVFLDGSCGGTVDGQLQWADSVVQNGVWDYGEGEAWTVTGAGGFYQFANLPPDHYLVAEVLKAGWKQTAPPSGTFSGDLAAGQCVTDLDFGNCQVGQGLTPGFWKNHTDQWVGYSPDQTLGSVFDLPDNLGLDDKTLLQALKFKGGSTFKAKVQIMLRQAVAALLNAAHPLVNYPLAEADIISAVNTAVASGKKSEVLDLKDLLASQNSLGGGIDAHGNPI